MFLKKSVIFWILFIHCSGNYICSSVLPCPKHKPYCTPVGCVYECPKDFFINGSTCVPTCGSWFTYEDKRCLPTCLDNYFTRDVVRLLGFESYLEKQCVTACEHGDYIFNGTCIEACPENFNYISEMFCLETCPENRKAMENFTKGGLLYHKCVYKCSWTSWYEENGFCTNECSENKFVFNQKCVEDCPKSHPFLHFRECVSECPSGKRVNNTCTSTCPYDMPFIFDKSCVELCPDEFPIVHALSNTDRKCVNVCKDYVKDDLCYHVCPSSTVMYNRTCTSECPETAPFICDVSCGESAYQGEMCVRKCPENMHLNNRRCVFTCPFVSYKHTCVEQCPDELPFLNNKTEGVNCSSNNECSRVQWYFECVDNCTDDKFLLLRYNTCVSYCPEDTVLLNRTCVDTCIDDVPFIENKTLSLRKWVKKVSYYYNYNWKIENYEQNVRHCVRKCKDGNFKLNFTCHDVCPGNKDSLITHDTEQYYVYNKSCVRNCPESHLLIGNSSWPDYCCCGSFVSRCYNMKWYLECMTDCPENTYMHQNRCISICPSALFIYRNTCVLSCPSTSDLILEKKIHVKHWIYQENLYGGYHEQIDVIKSVAECVSSCDENLIFNGTCIDFCPSHHKYVINGMCHNGTCGLKFQHQTRRGMECHDHCPTKTFLHKNTCVSSCSNGLISGDACVEACPHADLYRCPIDVILQSGWNSTSAGWVANEMSEINYVCCRRCPDKYLLDREKKRCVNKCPEYSSYSHNGICLKHCPEQTFLFKSEKGIQCLHRCFKEMFVGENRTCVTKCPDHLRYDAKSVCVSECPPARPFALDTYKCIAECEDSDKVYKADEKKCIFSFDCDSPYFVFNGQCLQECPSGYKWFILCYHVIGTIISISVLTILITIYIVHCRVLFKELFQFLYKCRDSCKNYDDQQFTAATVLKVQELDPVQLEESIEMDDIDITELLTITAT